MEARNLPINGGLWMDANTKCGQTNIWRVTEPSLVIQRRVLSDLRMSELFKDLILQEAYANTESPDN